MKTIKRVLVTFFYIIACLAFVVPFTFVVLMYIVFIPIYIIYYLFVETLCKLKEYICRTGKC